MELFSRKSATKVNLWFSIETVERLEHGGLGHEHGSWRVGVRMHRNAIRMDDEGRPSVSTIVFTNQKGGPGKSTLAVLYAHWLVDRQRERVCFIDLDSQRNSSKTLRAFDGGIAATALFAPTPVAVPARAAASLVLFGGARGLVDLERARPEVVIGAFRQQMALLNQLFDAVVIDTPPALGLRMSAALIAADYVVCPIELEEYSVDGVTDMLKTVFGVKQKYNPCLALLGIVANRFNPHSARQKEALADLIAHYAEFVVPAKISTRSAIPEALAAGVPVWRLAKTSARDATCRGRAGVRDAARRVRTCRARPRPRRPSMKLDLAGLDQFKASALLADPLPVGNTPAEMPLELIDFDPEQPRGAIDETALSELAASIREKGVLEPVSLRRHPDQPGRYIVNRGERRVRASRMAGRTTVPWFLDERIDRYAQVIENLQREDLSPFDLARFIAERERDGESRAEIARRLGKPASFITEAAGLIDAPESVRAAFAQGRARDTRVLYQLSRAMRENRAAADTLLAGDAPLTREAVEAALRTPTREAFAAASTARQRVEGTRQARAIIVEHDGRRARLPCNGQAGRRTGRVEYDDGTHQVVELAVLRLVAWAVR